MEKRQTKTPEALFNSWSKEMNRAAVDVTFAADQPAADKAGA